MDKYCMVKDGSTNVKCPPRYFPWGGGLGKVETAVFAEFKLLSRWGGWLGGWVGGSNGNKANLSPAEAGAGLSLAISASLNNLFQIGCTIIFMSAKLGTKKMLLRKRLGPKQILGPKKIWTVGSEGVGEVRGVWGSGQLR